MASRTAALESKLPADFPARDLWKPVVLLFWASRHKCGSIGGLGSGT